MRDDIEQPDQVFQRVSAGFKDLQNGKNHLIFAHSGVIQIILRRLDIHDLFLANCGGLAFEVDPNGSPFKLLSYWNHGY